MDSTSRDECDPLPIFASFPAEIVRLILEHLGRDSSGEAARLVCISRLVHAWMLPILYDTIVLKRSKDLIQIESNLATHRERRPYVHNISLQFELDHTNPIMASADARTFVVLLSCCRHIRSVYINSGSFPLRYSPAHLPRLVDLHCGSWDAWMTHDILTFHSLTHLRADLVHNTGVQSSWAPLYAPSHDVLPHLTHLAIGADGRATLSERRSTAEFLRGVLAARPRLTMLVVALWFCCGPTGLGMIADIADPRLCVLETDGCPDGESSLTEWEDAARGRQSIWNKARVVMERHQATGERGVPIGSIEWVSRINEHTNITDSRNGREASNPLA